MVEKIDLKKTYDRMEWAIVEETLKDATLPVGMINVIMSLIRLGHYKLIWNGEITDAIKSARGLRQGNPLAPYIFVLCFERLSHWNQMRVNEGRWRTLKTLRGYLSITPLFCR